MNSPMVRIVISLTINEGKLTELEELVQAMIVATRSEPGALGYDWYLTADRRQCRVLEAYADATALSTHLAGPVVREYLPKMLAVTSVRDIVIYGDPGPEAAAMMDQFGATICHPWQALER